MSLKQNLISFILRDAQDSEVKFMKAEIVQHQKQNTLFIIISECTGDENAVYLVENGLKNAKVKLF